MNAVVERFPPPNDPTAFESLCVDLWREIWHDPSAQKNGRNGQPQAGVDVFGQNQGKWVGVQCKQKDGLLRSKVTVKELDAEVEAAKRFKPPLANFTLATTGPRDGNVQERARALTEEHKQQGLFSVEVWSWDDIWDELYGRKDLMRRIAPEYWPLLMAVRAPRETLISSSRVTRGAERLIGREGDLKRIDAASIDPRIHILTIVAWGGVGKTSLVVEWMNRRAADSWPEFEQVFDWSFYSQGTHEQGTASADSFLGEALTFFGDETMANSPASPWDKGARLAQLIAAKRALLVLDGLESLQHPPGPLVGQLNDPAIGTLLKGLARQRNPGLCLITTRERVPDLVPFRDTTAPDWELTNLSPAAGVELLKSLGVQGTREELETLVKDVRGHALTLDLIGRFLAKAFHGDIRKRDLVKFEEADVEVQGGHAFRVMEAYEKWFSSGDAKAKRQLALLRLVGLFDRPADAGCLAALRGAPPIARLTNAFFHRCKGLAGLLGKVQPISDSEWNLAISGLADFGLVSYSRPTHAATLDLESWSLDSHPLVRTCFAKQLREDSPEAWRAAHRRLYEHLKRSTTKDLITLQPTLDDLQPLYQAVAHGCQAGLHAVAYSEVYLARICRATEAGDMDYSRRFLGAFGADLGAVACFFAEPWSLPSPFMGEALHPFLLSRAALDLRALGRTTEAIELTRTYLQRDIDNKDWRNAAIASNNLCELLLPLGDVDGAVRNAEQSIAFGDRGGTAFERLVSRATLADALHQAGRRPDAIARFLEAESLQAKFEPQYPLLYSLRGSQYCDLLLTEPQRAAWHTSGRAGHPEPPVARSDQNISPHLQRCREVEQRAREELKWTGGLDLVNLLDFGLDHLTLARAVLYRVILQGSDTGEAKVEIAQAVDGLRRSGYAEQMPRALLTRAWLRVLEGDTAGAQGDLDEAWEIAERGPMRLHMADIHLHRARLFYGKEDLQKARALIEQCGYWRLKEELEDAEVAAKVW